MERLELALTGASPIGLREGQESWEGLPLPARQQSLTAAGLSGVGGWVDKCAGKHLGAELPARRMEHLGFPQVLNQLE